MNADRDYVKDQIEKCRDRLLDTSKRNNLISFKHSQRSHRYIRVIDELPDFLYDELIEDKKLTFPCSLPEEGEIPPDDEQTPKFRRHLEQAKLTDEDYIKALDSLGGGEEGAQSKQIERDLRNKIREHLQMPAWQARKSLTNAEIAKKHGLNP